MEDLSTALFYDTVPDSWVARAYPSMMGLAAWYADLLLRIRVRTASGEPLHAQQTRPQGLKSKAGERECAEVPAGPALLRAGPKAPGPHLRETGLRVQALPLEGSPG